MGSQENLLRLIGKANKKFALIEDGDHIMVAVSGGKDSWSLLSLLKHYRAKSPLQFEITAVTLDQGQPGFCDVEMRKRYEAMQVNYRIEYRDTFSVVQENTPAGKAYCALCSRMRRGILYRIADELKANKIALGHHRDDFIETLLLNQFYAGRIRSMGVRLMGDDHSPEIIRPMVYVAESDLIEYAAALEFPIIPCNLCGSQDGLKRQQIKRLLTELESQNPRIRGNLLAALGNIDESHLLLGASTTLPSANQQESAMNASGSLVQLVERTLDDERSTTNISNQPAGK